MKFTDEYFEKIDIFFFVSTNEVSKTYIPKLLKYPNLIIDNSSYFRMNKYVPLVIPSVNFNEAINYKLISNPNCSTIEVIPILDIIHKLFKIKKINYSTYQAVSGSGINGVLDLKNNKQKYYPYLITATCIPCIGSTDEKKYTTEETKMIKETNKILNSKIDITATCVRVPVEIGHGISVFLETKKKVNLKKIISKLNEYSAIIVKDDLESNIYPTSIDTFNNNKIYVGRIRNPNEHTLLFYVTSNNLLTGAASNALEIAEKYIYNLKRKKA